MVTANPDTWTFDPFSLTRDGDKLMGRGVTDCLGHVALLTELFRALGTTRPPLRTTVIGVFIANEENATVGAGLLCVFICVCVCVQARHAAASCAQHAPLEQRASQGPVPSLQPGDWLLTHHPARPPVSE